MSLHWKTALLVSLLLSSNFAHARTASNKDLEARAEKTDARIDGLEDRVNQSLVQLQQQIDSAREQLRVLRGQIEEADHELEKTRQQQRDLYSDLDGRVLYLENAAGVSARGATTEPTSGDIVSADETAVYGEAFAALKAGRYEEADRGFRMYLTKYPQGPRADSAAYWLGETQFVSQDYKAALATFESLLKDYPESRKAADAMLKVGYCQYELKAFGNARKTLQAVAKTYPGTEAARQAEGKLVSMDAEGR